MINRVRLGFDEFHKLLELDLSNKKRLEKTRDLFIVGCFSGLRFSDWHKVSRENISIEEGAELLQIFMQKTNKYVYIPVLPELKEILIKYDYNLPKISAQKFNAYIKEACQLAIEDKTFQRIYSVGGTIKNETIEKWKKTSSHAARRSFASNFWDLGLPATELMQITGHSTEKQFFEYIDVSAKELAKRMAKEIAMKRNDRKLKVVK